MRTDKPNSKNLSEVSAIRDRPQNFMVVCKISVRRRFSPFRAVLRKRYVKATHTEASRMAVADRERAVRVVFS